MNCPECHTAWEINKDMLMTSTSVHLENDNLRATIKEKKEIIAELEVTNEDLQKKLSEVTSDGEHGRDPEINILDEMDGSKT